MQLMLTPKTVLGLALGSAAVSLSAIALRVLAEGTSEVVNQREALAKIVGKHADKLDEFDRETLRKMGIAVMSAKQIES